MATDQLATDAIFDVLADHQRRKLLAHLRAVGDASVEELASVIDGQADEIRRGNHDLAVRLHHVHLPKLADAGLVEYDRSAERVTYVGDSEIADLLAVSPGKLIPG